MKRCLNCLNGFHTPIGSKGLCLKDAQKPVGIPDKACADWRPGADIQDGIAIERQRCIEVCNVLLQKLRAAYLEETKKGHNAFKYLACSAGIDHALAAIKEDDSAENMDVRKW